MSKADDWAELRTRAMELAYQVRNAVPLYILERKANEVLEAARKVKAKC